MAAETEPDQHVVIYKATIEYPIKFAVLNDVPHHELLENIKDKLEQNLHFQTDPSTLAHWVLKSSDPSVRAICYNGRMSKSDALKRCDHCDRNYRYPIIPTEGADICFGIYVVWTFEDQLNVRIMRMRQTPENIECSYDEEKAECLYAGIIAYHPKLGSEYAIQFADDAVKCSHITIMDKNSCKLITGLPILHGCKYYVMCSIPGLDWDTKEYKRMVESVEIKPMMMVLSDETRKKFRERFDLNSADPAVPHDWIFQLNGNIINS